MHHPDLRAKQQQAFDAAVMDGTYSDPDLYGISTSTRSQSSMGKRGSSASTSTGLFNRLRGKGGNNDFDEMDGTGMRDAVSDTASFRDLSVNDLSSLRDRHRYPAFDDNASRVSSDTHSDIGSAYHGTQDSTPIIPTFGSTPVANLKQNKMQYRQNLIDRRRQLLSNEIYGMTPQAPIPGSRTQTMTSMRHPPDYPRTMSLGGASMNELPIGRPRGSQGPYNMPSQGYGGPGPHGSPGHFGPPQGFMPGPGPHNYGPPGPRSVSRMSTNDHSPLSREVLPGKDLMAANRELEEQVRALNAQLAQQAQQARQSQQAQRAVNPEHVENLEAANRQLEDEVTMLTAQLAGLSQPHDNWETENRELKSQVQDLNAKLAQLAAEREPDAELEASHRELEAQVHQLHEQLAQVTAQAASGRQADLGELEQVNKLRQSNRRLEEEVKVLSVELAESARRELGLDPTSDSAVTAQELAKLQDMLLIERQRHDGTARGRYSTTEAFTELEHKHAEATQLLEVRSQELEQLRERTVQLTADLAVADERADSLAAQTKELQVVKAQAEQNSVASAQLEELTAENDRLRNLLNKHAESGTEERLRVADKQREALQEALRSLRERKDQEIVVLHTRIEKLEERLARFAPATTRSFSLEEYQNSDDSSTTSLPAPLSKSQRQHQLSISTKLANENDDFEPPRVRQSNMRPASPLHLNFGLNEAYAPPLRSVSRTATVPLALGGS